jgi:hypothetical protein
MTNKSYTLSAQRAGLLSDIYNDSHLFPSDKRTKPNLVR